MTDLLISLGKLAIGFLCILGPLVLYIALHRLRDRREITLSTKVLQGLNSPEFRGLYSMKVRSRLIGADKVIVDLWGCSRDQVWDLMEKLYAELQSKESPTLLFIWSASGPVLSSLPWDKLKWIVSLMRSQRFRSY